MGSKKIDKLSSLEKIKKSKELFDIEALTQEEFDELKKDFIHEIKSMPIPQDMNTLPKIKESKKLLDMGALTQEEFDEIKNKYLTPIIKSDSNDIANNERLKNKSRKDKEKQKYLKNKSKKDKEKHEKFMEEKQGLKTCPNCGKKILYHA